jgi:predicted nucleotidyltransferase component of viral defense system
MAGVKMDSSSDKLTALQRALLEAFFRVEQRFFLTGGAALAGFHLGHRPTLDLDLFTLDPEAFETGRRGLEEAAAALGAAVVVRQRAPGFERYVVSLADESVVVDLVLERVTQVSDQKHQVGTISVDPVEEILVNKLTAVLSRAEERDLVDLLFLERKGLKIEDWLSAALRKDGGCTPAALAWVLSEVTVPDGTRLPSAVSPAELRAFVADLVIRLRRAAFPDPSAR